MTYLKQKYNDNQKGDCQRSVFACLLGFDDVEQVPNFSEQKNFFQSMLEWLDKNNLQYIEQTFESFKKTPFITLGYCTLVGKSPRGDYNHIVIGEVKIEDGNYTIYFHHDTSPLHDGLFLDGEIQYIGFLGKKLLKEDR